MTYNDPLPITDFPSLWNFNDKHMNTNASLRLARDREGKKLLQFIIKKKEKLLKGSQSRQVKHSGP